MSSPVSYPADGHHQCFELDEASFWYRHRNRCLAAAMSALPPREPLFDIGGGNGAVAVALQAAGRRVCVVEPIAAGAHHAKQRGLTRVVCCSLEESGFREGAISSAALFDVLEHIPDDEAFLLQLRAQLAAGARLYITVPAFQSLWSQHDADAGHHRRYTARSLARLVSNSGFKVDYISFFFTPLPLPIFLLRTLPSHLRRLLRVSPGNARQRRRREHVSSKRHVGGMLEALLRFEVGAIRRRRTLPFGSSLLLVAHAD